MTKSVDRRKHQRMWTVQEVTKLVDGICQFGVGHWTDIKRLSFASSAHRTPIDLRVLAFYEHSEVFSFHASSNIFYDQVMFLQDKWRNLLRASHAQQPEKGEV